MAIQRAQGNQALEMVPAYYPFVASIFDNCSIYYHDGTHFYEIRRAGNYHEDYFLSPVGSFDGVRNVLVWRVVSATERDAFHLRQIPNYCPPGSTCAHRRLGMT